MKNILIFVVVIAFVVISNSVFIVDEREHALKFRFGEVIKSDYEPGIHFKVPFVNNVQKYSKQC
jgi:membrane protease subunit HflC